MQRINTIVLAGLILAAAPVSDLAAQPHTGRIAFDFCYSVYAPEGGFIMQCACVGAAGQRIEVWAGGRPDAGVVARRHARNHDVDLETNGTSITVTRK